MASRRPLGSFLEWQGNSIRVVLSVPKALQPLFRKTKLKEPLGTDSPARAEVLKWAVIAKLKAELDGVAKVAGNPLITEALKWKQEIADAPLPEDEEDDYDQPGLLSVLLEERTREVESEQGAAAATAFFGVASGTATPLKANLETFLVEKPYSARYKDDVRRAVGRLATWCAKGGAPETLEAITRKVAGQFISTGLTLVLTNRKTINKDISALSSYWDWLGRRGHLGDELRQPWEKQGFEVRRSADLGEGGFSRAFTSEEAATLLYGPASRRMRDIMWIGALSGMRIDEVCRLQVRDCADGWFAVNARRFQTGEGKTNAAHRAIPVHTALAALVQRSSAGKRPDALLIDGLPVPDPNGKRKPSAAAGQEFTRYRRKQGVDDMVEGQRRSRVVFHSWRSWFITEALRADHPLHIVKPLVGHAGKEGGITTKAYFRDGPSGDQARAVVASVQPPPKKIPADDDQSPRAGSGRKRPRGAPATKVGE